MHRVPKRPIGVWFSIALLLLLLGGWLGYIAGIAAARARFRAQEQHTMSRLDSVTRTRLNSTLSALSVIEMFRVTAHTPQGSSEDVRRATIKIQSLGRLADATDLQPVVSLNQGIAYVNIAIAEERDNPAESRKYMNLAQDLFRSLGWRDCSEDTLKAAAQDQYKIRAPKPKKDRP